MLKLLLLAVLATSAYGLPGSSRMCETVDVTEAWPGGYKATVSFSAPSAYSSVVLDLYFIHPVGSLQMNGGTVTSESNTHFTFSSSDSGSAGSTVSYDFQTSYSEQQPLLGELSFNGADVCGAGSGLTTDPPLSNPCSGSGYEQVLCMSILFYEAQRSGALPADQRVTWRWDSALNDGQDVGKDLTGGYYDAGDHVKFGFPLAYTGTVLAWGVIEYEAGFTAAGELANAKAAVRWVSDYLLKAHSPGELYGQVGDGGLDHAYWGRPEEMTMARPSAKISTSAPGSDLAGETAAALAAASIVFADDASYSSECLAAARDLFSLADDHRGIYTDSIGAAAGYYNSFSGYGDELGWAAAWLYKATGEAAYLDAAKGFWTEFNLGGDAVQFGWDDKKAGVYVLMSELDGGSTYTSALEGFLDRTLNEATYTPGGLVHLDTWGALRHAMNVAFIALRAADLGFSASTHRAWAVGQLEYVLGSNGHSFIVGYGVNPPQRPHHRASSCPQYPASCQDAWSQNQPGPNPQPLYGAMVGGPDTSDGYVDDRMDYIHNEVACDYNAGLVGVLAAVVQNGL